jgi:ABC-2 type transport system ATP-binding protein
MAIIEVQGLSKKFKTTQALRELSLSIDKGELFGLIGPDGAGKTTFFRILAAILLPSAGNVMVCGTDVKKNPEDIKSKIGVVPQTFSLYPDLTVEENLWFFAHMYGIAQHDFVEKKKRLLHIARLEPFLKRKAEHLSGGMQKKLALISSLMHTPELLLLDEPTTGVDPVSRREFWDFLHELFEQGMTIIISTPYMDEAERCSRVGFLYQGELLLTGDPLQIKKDYPYVVLEVSKGNLIKIRDSKFPEETGVQDTYPVGNTLHIVVAQGRESSVKKVIQESDPNASVSVVEPTFEDAFIALIKKKV